MVKSLLVNNICKSQPSKSTHVLSVNVCLYEYKYICTLNVTDCSYISLVCPTEVFASTLNDNIFYMSLLNRKELNCRRRKKLKTVYAL